MIHDSDAVIKCLAGSRSTAVARLISRETGKFSTSEVLEIELAMYQKLPQGANIGKMQSALRGLISARDPNHDSVNKAGVAHRYPTPSNPHANGLLEAEKTYGIAVQWLECALKPLGKNRPSGHGSTSAFSLLVTFIVAAIIDFEFLHTDFIPALIEALQRGGTISLNRAMIGVSLSLRHGQQENAEARLLIARGATATQFRRLLSHKDLRVALDRLVIPGTKPDQVAIVRAIDQQIASMQPSIECVCITQLLKAAGQFSTTDILRVIGEARKREIVAHGLRPQVLKRIQRKQIASKMQIRIPVKRLAGLRDVAEPWRTANATVEPKWLVRLRKALPKDGTHLPLLQDLASGSDIIGCRMGEFALYLSARLGPSSVNRYTMLIASRIMSRPELENCDAVRVLEEEWEEIIEKVLDEDETFRLRRYTDSPVTTGKEYSFALLKALRYFFRFLRLMQPDRPLAQIEGSIPATGIIRVDANMMTIDEYKAALAWLSGPHGFSDRYMRSASRVVLILGYRCGLRRSEAAYLRLSDFDDANYLHVRPWSMRKLKTANALRDLPLRVLMPEDELQEVLAFIATARARGKYCSEGALLFAKEGNARVLINFERVIGQVHCAMRTIDPSLHFHSLRHSYCNILLLKLWPSLHPVARLVFRHHPAMIASFGDPESFRQRLFETTAIKGADLQAIALLMGHGSALVSLGHYIHVLDWYDPERHALPRSLSSRAKLGLNEKLRSPPSYI